MINTNIHNEPIFFNCYPNFCVYVTCPMIPKALMLDVHIQGNEFHDFKNFVIMYRVYFRLMFTNLNTKFLNPLPSIQKKQFYFKLKMTKPKLLHQNFSNGMRLQFRKLLSLKTLNMLLLTNLDR